MCWHWSLIDSFSCRKQAKGILRPIRQSKVTFIEKCSDGKDITYFYKTLIQPGVHVSKLHNQKQVYRILNCAFEILTKMENLPTFNSSRIENHKDNTYIYISSLLLVRIENSLILHAWRLNIACALYIFLIVQIWVIILFICIDENTEHFETKVQRFWNISV
jgi:hypothetical protein